MTWLMTILKYVARNPWVWALGSQVSKYIIKPVINKIKKKKDDGKGMVKQGD